MSDVDGETAAVDQASTSSKKSGKNKASGNAAAKKTSTKPSHPKTADMVNAAIVGLKERGGSSLQAIKKYISTNYKVDADKMAIFIRKYLKSAVTSGSLVQTKGKGASGSFKMATVATEKVVKRAAKPPKSPKAKAAATKPKKEKKPKKSASPKKAEAAPKKSQSATKAPAVKSKPSSAKSKTASRSPTKKPKAPKPKKATASKPKSPTKTTQKKK